MKKILLLLSCIFLITNVFAQAPNWIWTKTATTAIATNCYNYGIAVDKYDNVYSAGFLGGTACFGDDTITAVDGAYLAKYDAYGNEKWALVSQGSWAFGYGVATDRFANVYLTGEFGGSVIFGSHILFSAGGDDAFIVKYDSSGNSIWAKSIGGSLEERAVGIAADSSGNIYVSGCFTSHLVSAGNLTLTNTGNSGVFLTKFDSSGNAIWIKGGLSVANSSGIYNYQVTVDRDANPFIAGSFNTPSIVFNTDTLLNTSSGATDIYLVKYDSTGNFLWARKGGGTRGDNNHGISTDEMGSVYITGDYSSASIMFNSTILTNVNTNSNGYIVKYDSLGNVIWGKAITDNLNSKGYGIAAGQGKVYISGGFSLSDTVYIDTMALTTPLGSINPMFFSALDSAGNDLFARAVSSGASYGNSIALSNPGCIYLGGTFDAIVLILGHDTIITGHSKSMPFISKLCYGEIGVDVSENNRDNIFSIYPNPTHTTFTISLSNPFSTFNSQLSIYDITGREVYEQTIRNPEKNGTSQKSEIINCQLSAGVYLVKVQAGEKVMTEKLVVE